MLPKQGDGFSLDTSVPVLLFKIGRYVIHHGSLGVIRSLGRAGVPVYAIVEDRLTPIALSRYLAGAFVRDTSTSDACELLGDLASIGGHLGRKAVLVPTDDRAAIFLSEHCRDLEKWYFLPPVATELPRLVANKNSLYELCRSTGLPCPETAFPRSMNEVDEFMDRVQFPIMVKTAECLPGSATPQKVVITRTRSELVSLYRNRNQAESLNFVLQEYIPHSYAEDWIFHGYCNPTTDCFVPFTGKKLRSFPAFAGFTTLGISARNETLCHQSREFLQSIGYAGIVDMDYRFDKRDGRYKLLDCNPRIGANFCMFRDDAGLDVVRALHLDLTGRTVRQVASVEGRKFLVEPYDLFGTLGYMRKRELTVREWWHTLQGEKEFAWFSRADPAPFLGMCGRLGILMVAGAGRRALKRVRALARQNGQA